MTSNPYLELFIHTLLHSDRSQPDVAAVRESLKGLLSFITNPEITDQNIEETLDAAADAALPGVLARLLLHLKSKKTANEEFNKMLFLKACRGPSCAMMTREVLVALGIHPASIPLNMLTDLPPQIQNEVWGVMLTCTKAPQPYIFRDTQSRMFRLVPEFVGVHLVCPLTGCLMEDPVTASDGVVYERQAILSYFLQTPGSIVRSPVTREMLDSYVLKPHLETKLLRKKAWAGSVPSRQYPSPSCLSHVESIRRLIMLGLHGIQRYEVHDISYIGTETNWDRYSTEISHIQRISSPRGIAKEYLVFHGPRTEANMESILASGFDERRSGVGTAGRGVYFSQDVMYILETNRAVTQHRDGVSLVSFLIARVAPGSDAQQVHRPLTDFLCIRNGAQAFPEFKITLRVTTLSKHFEARVQFEETFPSLCVLPDIDANPIPEFASRSERVFVGVPVNVKGKWRILGTDSMQPPAATVVAWVETGHGCQHLNIPISEWKQLVENHSLYPPACCPWGSRGFAFGPRPSCSPLLFRYFEALEHFLTKPAPGVTMNGVPATFDAVFRCYALNGIPMCIIGGAVRSGISDTMHSESDSQESEPRDRIKDVDVSFVAPAWHMEAIAIANNIGGLTRSPSGLVSWGTLLEGKPMATPVDGLANECQRSGNRSMCNFDIAEHSKTLDFTVNTVAYIPRCCFKEGREGGLAIDPTGHGMHDCWTRILRIPLPPERWYEWLQLNPSKTYRGFKMRLMGYLPLDDATHRFLFVSSLQVVPALPAALRENLFQKDIGQRNRKKFVEMVQEDFLKYSESEPMTEYFTPGVFVELCAGK